jgi:hypothetical protein
MPGTANPDEGRCVTCGAFPGQPHDRGVHEALTAARERAMRELDDIAEAMKAVDHGAPQALPEGPATGAKLITTSEGTWTTEEFIAALPRKRDVYMPREHTLAVARAAQELLVDYVREVIQGWPCLCAYGVLHASRSCPRHTLGPALLIDLDSTREELPIDVIEQRIYDGAQWATGQPIRPIDRQGPDL